jgi:8-oxo-dGTP pyrophosphatase MutT (NUDIX family)
MMHLGPEQKEGQAAVPRDAATVLLLRPGPGAAGGFEVFMVKRSGLSDVLGEAHVFPGGKIDAADGDPAMLPHLEGTGALDAAALGEQLSTERLVAMYVAAARETFEEAGVLLAKNAGSADLAAGRRRLNAKEGFADVLGDLVVKLDLGALVPWVRWVTPAFLARRFDARFFLAAAPPDQHAVHDNYEATHSEWLAPRAALRRWEQGEIKLAPATYMSLYHLATYESIAQAMADARSRPAPIIVPQSFEQEGVRHIVLPGDSMHAVATPAIPGPVRLRWDGARYAPVAAA